MSEPELLFSTYELRLVFDKQRGRMYESIDSIDANQLLNTKTDDWCDYYENEYKIDVPIIYEDKISISQEDAKIEQHYGYRIGWVNGTQYTFHVPFEGDPNIFKTQPSTFTLSPPHAAIGNNELLFILYFSEHNPEQVKSTFNRCLSELKQYLEWHKNDLNIYNESLRINIGTRIEQRRTKILKDRSIVEAIGYPLRPRNGAVLTYQATITRKKIIVEPPQTSSTPFTSEPSLDMEQYEQILAVINSMVKVMERSPSSFTQMDEPALRDQILVPLNAQFEGDATGETFNGSGKTDILIRVKDKNIFIAECKMWRGAQYLKEAIDQLLDYSTWRDTKTAILIFNRNKEFTNVLKSIDETVPKHSNYKRSLQYLSETGFRYVIFNKDDKNREIILTVLAFDVPT